MIFQYYNKTITLNDNNNYDNNNNTEIMASVLYNKLFSKVEVASSGGYQYTLKQ